MKGYSGRGCRLLFTLAIVSAMLLVLPISHATAKKKSKKAKQEDTFVMSEAELQSQVMSYADRLAMILSSAFYAYEQQSPPSTQHRVIAIDTVYTIAAAYTIAAETDPDGGLLDMVSMVTLGRIIYEKVRRKGFGKQVQPLLEGYRAAERDIWFLAAQLLTEPKQRELRMIIDDWRKKHPEVDNYFYVRFADFSEERKGSLLSKTDKTGGIFKSVDRMTQQVEEFRILSERGLYLVSRMPLLTGLFADVWVSRIMLNPELKMVLEDIHTFAEVSKRFAVVAEKMPEGLPKEREQIINQAMLNANRLTAASIEKVAEKFAQERDAAVKQLIEEFSIERKKAMDDMLVEENRIKSLLTELRQTLDAGSNMVTATNTLVERLNIGQGTPKASAGAGSTAAKTSEPVDLKDVEVILTKTAGVVNQMNRILANLDQLMASQGWQQTLPQLLQAAESIQEEGRAWITRMIILGIVLIFAGCIGIILALLVYRFVAERYIVPSRMPADTM